MSIFNLPDLGEGLPDAEIHEWFVKEGDLVKVDQPLVAMETAKAVVDIPCPQNGTIKQLYGKPGDRIKTGEPLVLYVNESARIDQGTVVGNLEESTEISEDNFTLGSTTQSSNRPKATPLVKLLAKKLGVDLHTLQGSGEYGVITTQDVEQAASEKAILPENYLALTGVRHAMLKSMEKSHQEVVSVSIFDEADINDWHPEQDITVRLIQAIIYGCQQEPALNAWFNTQYSARRCLQEVHLGLAMDNVEGLFVPVIHDAHLRSAQELRQIINEYKEAIKTRTIAPDKLKGATITLSNFGKFAGRFASPIIVPPMVAILAIGQSYQAAVVSGDSIKAHRLLPLSLSFDHRAVTGGEATRFLGAVITALQKPQ